jgi:cytochrome c-type biogenesis protein CcmF
VFVAGVTLVKSYEAEREVRLEPGQSVTVGGYAFRFEGVRAVEGPNYSASRATVTVLRGEEAVARLHPEKRIYRVQRMPMTEAAIDYGLLRHLYVSLGDPLEGGAWTLRAQVKPFVGWIWIGCLIMALGGVLAAADRRYRTGAAGRAAPALAQGARA